MWVLNVYLREINRIIWVMYIFNRVVDKFRLVGENLKFKIDRKNW